MVDPLFAKNCSEKERRAENRGDQDAPQSEGDQEGEDRDGIAANGVYAQPIIGDDRGCEILRGNERRGQQLCDRDEPRIIAASQNGEISIGSR